jgi:CO/xanthine dehydrogenase FAD-binding subunit
VKDSPENKIPEKAISIDRTITGFGRFEPDYSLTNCMMTFIEVEVDTQRKSIDFAIVSVASVISMADGFCKDAQIVLGAVAPTPYRVRGAEDALRGRPLDTASAEAVVIEARPLSKNAYKVEITKALVREALLFSENY